MSVWDNLYELRSFFYFPVGFLVLCTVFAFIKKLIWQRLENIFKRTQAEWDDALLKGLERPTRYLVILAALTISLQWAPVIVSNNWWTSVLSRITLILVFSWMLDRTLVVFLFHTKALSSLSPTLRNLLKVLLRMIVYSIAGLISLESFGVSITPLLASLGVGSLAVALALQDTLGNLFSGFYLVIDRPIRVEDVIRLEDGTEGKVKNIGWRSTRIELGSGNTVILPNSKLSSSRITNYELPTPEVTFNVSVQIKAKNDLDKAERVAFETAQECQSNAKGAVHSFKPVLNFQTVNPHGVEMVVSLRSEKLADLGKVRHEYIKSLIKKFKTEGIEISSWTGSSVPQDTI